MHNYTHEYKDASKKVGGRVVRFKQYIGSRCIKATCDHNRRPSIIDTVKRHNDATGEMFSRFNSVTVHNNGR